ncbi:hypothetical protein COT65_01620 [Candidatus Shapirobacteria bacterium CG09_land_8_20_14_0_10_47_13]|uniref:Uncharacterized protein n=1 Tax=Candidatus Shapirobacteria bacterium CG09_land_8_20_14_0_10_47_13 TaxID=1974481 RepID=A0A2H0WMP4_9BACT|nr:MAG: hypothetical protein COT65_01620 [Candidatus Shapirobacteria bacterium CG09_land_8_20_14_0_10_47_13]
MSAEQRVKIPVVIVRGFGGLMGASPTEVVGKPPAEGKEAPRPEVAPDDKGRSGFIRLAETPPDDS